MAQHSCAGVFRSFLFVAAASFGVCPAASAVPVIWTGPNTSFSKTGSDDPTLPANQDRLTDNVWLTRGEVQGLFNIAPGKETFFTHNLSPADTKWATGWMSANAGKEITASNHLALIFTDWEASYGARQMLQGNITNYDAVVHLVTDDIFLNLRFTEWLSFGDFAYTRSSPSVVAPTGDYNGNNVVDAADYVVWRKTLDQSASPAGSGADGNSSGQVEAGDYTYWRERFGNAAGSGLRGSSVPEPTTAFLILATSIFFQQRRRKRVAR